MPIQKKPASEFGARLIALRKAREMTQIDLANAVGTTQRSISYYEAVADFPPTVVVVALAKALGVTPDDLLLDTKALPAAVSENPNNNPEVRRYWKRFQQLMGLPEKDQRAVLRMLDTMTKAQVQ